MSCVFKHKESKINTLSELKEQDILDGPYIKSGKDEQFNQYHNDLIESVQENYNLGIDKFFNVLEQKTTGLFGIVKKFVQPIDSSFKQLDQARKDLGIYDSKESYLSFKEAAEAKSIKLDEISNIKPGVAELFESNPELADAVYSKILTNSGISAENLLSLLEKENIVEKDCSGGKLKAKDGIRGKFTKGSKWEIVKDLKGYPSHAQGGVDVKIGKNGFSFTRDNGVIEAKHGLVLPKIK